MSRGLTAGQISALSNRTNVFEYLVVLTTNSQTYRFTSGQFDVSVSGNTYIKDNGISSISQIYGEQQDLSSVPFKITFDTVDDTFIANVTDDYRNSTVIQVSLLFRDSSSFTADTSNTINLFEGVCDGVNLVTSSNTQQLVLDFTNELAGGFVDTYGRKASGLTKLSSTTTDRVNF